MPCLPNPAQSRSLAKSPTFGFFGRDVRQVATAQLGCRSADKANGRLRSHVARFQFDQRVSAGITLVAILWVQGHLGQALREMEDVIAGALIRDHTLSLINALTDGTCPIALSTGDLAAAERYTVLLEENTSTRALDVWHSYAECFRGKLLIRSGEAAAWVVLPRRATGVLQRSGFVLFRTASAVRRL